MTGNRPGTDVVAGTPIAGPGGGRRGTPAPWWLWALALVVVLPVAIPVSALLVRAVGASDAAWETLASMRTVELLVRTVGFTIAVTASATVMGVAGAWLLTRTDLGAKRAWGVAFALPLVIPSYVLAMVLVSATGPRGLLSDLTGIPLPHLVGFPGAWLALTLATYPYVYLVASASLSRMDPALEEVARSLGASRRRVFRTVTLPHLRPAIGAGALLVALYTLSDFGAVSLMRFDAFTRAIYGQWAGRLDRTPAIVLSIVLIAIALVVILVEQRTSARGGMYHSRRPKRAPAVHRLARGERIGAISFLGVTVAIGAGVPILVLGAWVVRGVRSGVDLDIPFGALGGSIVAGSAAAIVAVAAAVPIAVLAVRHTSRATTWLERTVYIGFSLPHITIAIAVVAFTVRYARPVYQSMIVLVVVYAAMFLAQVTGPAKASLLQVDPTLDDASRSLGRGRARTMARVTVPLMAPGLLAGGLLVFVTTLKELPATLLLRPSGFSTLAVRIWSASSELLYTRAALAALVLIAISIGPVYYLSIRPKEVA